MLPHLVNTFLFKFHSLLESEKNCMWQSLLDSSFPQLLIGRLAISTVHLAHAIQMSGLLPASPQLFWHLVGAYLLAPKMSIFTNEICSSFGESDVLVLLKISPTIKIPFHPTLIKYYFYASGWVLYLFSESENILYASISANFNM